MNNILTNFDLEKGPARDFRPESLLRNVNLLVLNPLNTLPTDNGRFPCKHDTSLSLWHSSHNGS